MTNNEAETPYYLIDPVLREKSCDDHQWVKLETPAPVEPTGPKGRRQLAMNQEDLARELGGSYAPSIAGKMGYPNLPSWSEPSWMRFATRWYVKAN